MSTEPASVFARTILEQKQYVHKKGPGQRESWDEAARRVAHSVMGGRAPQDVILRVEELIRNRQFMPGGRYLYAAGRKLPQVNNCALFRAQDSREGWGNLLRKSAETLMTGAGIGVVYSDLREKGAHIGGMGGTSSGPMALMTMENEVGRGIRQGGDRRSAIWAGLHWNHPDCPDFIFSKNWPAWLTKKKEEDFNTPAPMDGTNISVILDDDFFSAYHDPSHRRHAMAHDIYWAAVVNMLRTGEPGFSVDVGENEGENLRNAPVAGGTHVLTPGGYQKAGDIVDAEIVVWTGKRWAWTTFRKTGDNVPVVRVKMTGGREIVCSPEHEFLVERWQGAGEARKLGRVDRVAAENLQTGDTLHVCLADTGRYDDAKTGLDKKGYTLGFLFGDGHFSSKNTAELSICDESKTPCRAHLEDSWIRRITEKDARGYTRIYLKHPAEHGFSYTKGELPQIFQLCSDDFKTSFIAGLFDADGSCDPKQNRVRLSSTSKEFLHDVRRLLESLGILAHVNVGSLGQFKGTPTWMLVVAADYITRFKNIIPTARLKPSEHESYRDSKIKVVSVTDAGREDVFCCDVGFEEHSFMAEGVIISNCTEVVSRKEDLCNLGSLNLARFDCHGKFTQAVADTTAFLLCGTLYSALPCEDLRAAREQDRRIGLGLMGMHEWLLVRGKTYGPDDDLSLWLKTYKESSDSAALYWANELRINPPIDKRAVAPTGTISIVAETTSGIEPMLASAFLRRYLKGDVWHAQYVVDACAQRLVDKGVDPDLIEDAYDLAADVDRRLAFQAYVQRYVDQGISSTINLPAWGSARNNESTAKDFGERLMNYLPFLRGVTVYPDGSRGGQPLTKVPYRDAVKRLGVEFEEYGNSHACAGGVCGV